jgi:hypothetical protein
MRSLNDARSVSFTRWDVGEGESDGLACIVRAFEQDPHYEGSGVKLTIQDYAGKPVFEDYFSDVGRIYSSYALREPEPQLVVEVDYGGSASFLKILDYRDGKIVDLMSAVKPDADFAIGAQVRPQLRTGINPAKEPYEVLLTQGTGLAGLAPKRTEIFRYKDGYYRYCGDFEQSRVDDYAENLLKRSSNQTLVQK